MPAWRWRSNSEHSVAASTPPQCRPERRGVRAATTATPHTLRNSRRGLRRLSRRLAAVALPPSNLRRLCRRPIAQSLRTDVYSFSVILLELLVGMPAREVVGCSGKTCRATRTRGRDHMAQEGAGRRREGVL
jgi:hypothetical protein